MSELLQYDASAADLVLGPEATAAEAESLERARGQLLADAAGAEGGSGFEPLDAGFIDWPAKMMADEAELSRIEETAGRFREQADEVVLLGIGGSSIGPRAIFAALCDPYHNERSRDARLGAPRIYFEGDNLDNDALVALLDRLAQLTDERWHLVVTSKSGGTIETALSLRIFLAALESRCRDGDELAGSLAVMTGADGPLRELAASLGCNDLFTIPEAIGGRFSVLTAVGLLPAAILGLDIRRLLEGAVAITDWFRKAPPGENPVLDHAATGIAAEKQGRTIRVLSAWNKSLEPLGFWHDQLLAESLGKQGRGPTPLTALNTRDLHSRGQQHQDGRHDKLITNLLVDEPQTVSLVVPARADDLDGLNPLAGRTVPEILAAAIRGTNRAYAQDARPTADLRLPRLDEFVLGQLMQMLMLAVAVEGYAVGINPFGQPGVTAYKQQMQAELREL